MRSMLRRTRVAPVVFVATISACLLVGAPGGVSVGTAAAAANATTTPIKHLVVIFQENVSFDHYFATYPNAANTSGQPFRGFSSRAR